MSLRAWVRRSRWALHRRRWAWARERRLLRLFRSLAPEDQVQALESLESQQACRQWLGIASRN